MPEINKIVIDNPEVRKEDVENGRKDFK